mgnify:CR=1 FL=1
MSPFGVPGRALRVVACTAVLISAASACSGGGSASNAEHVAAQAVAPPQRDSLANDLLVAGEDTSLERLRALDDSLSRDPSGSRAPLWLWTLGRLTRHTHGTIAAGTPDTTFVTIRRDQYWASEPDAQWVYNGYHYRELVRRFPADSLADDALYALTFLDIAGECEGDVVCYIGRDTGPLDDFLRRFPGSRYAPAAAERLANELKVIFTLVPKERELWVVDSVAVREQTAHLDSTVTALPDPMRLDVSEVLAFAWQRLGNAARASELHDWVKVNRRGRAAAKTAGVP